MHHPIHIAIIYYYQQERNFVGTYNRNSAPKPQHMVDAIVFGGAGSNKGA